MEEELLQSEEKKSKSLKKILQETGNWIKGVGKTIAYNWDIYDMNAKCLGLGLFVALDIGMVLGIDTFIGKPLRAKENLTQITQEVLVKYGDTNKDGYISQTEKDSLYSEIFKGRGVTCISGEKPVYSNGKTVSSEELTNWIKGYMTLKERK
ncbi:Uncharacterised protein [uncultured archaeon]|nr:Uncharacterised protein [uncultured archaeon]